MNRSTDPLFDHRIATWLEEDPNRAPGQVLDTVLAAVPSISQRRRPPVPWRFSLMTNSMRAAAAIAIVAVVGVGALWYSGRGSNVGGPGATPTPVPTVSVTPIPTVSATPVPTFNPNTGTWTGYTSEVHGFTTAYPPGWRVEQAATRPWDATLDVPLGTGLSPALDAFVNPAGSVAVTVWRIPVEIEPLENSRTAVIAWVEEFCVSMEYYQPCDGIAERAIPMCRERRDCHPDAVIVPFKDDVLAVFVAGDGTLTLAQVLRADASPTTVEYGGSIRLLQLFLERMNVTVPGPGQGG